MARNQPGVQTPAEGRTSSAGLGPSDYDAFISYSQAADAQLARAIQDALTRLGKPWRKRRALRLYLDQADMTLNPDLWESIADVLGRSRWLVLLLSPEAAQSRWVNREVEEWLERRGGDAQQILLVLTGGSLHWDVESTGFDQDSDALPPSLVGAFGAEPLHLDLRWARSSDSVDLTNARFRSAIVSVAAPIHGLSPDELESEDLRQHRRSVRIRRAAIAVLSVLTVATVLSTILALRSAAEAEDQARRALAQAYSSTALNLQATDPAVALHSAIEGYELVDPPTETAIEARVSTSANFRTTNAIAVHEAEHGAPVTAGVMSADETMWLTGGSDGQIRFWGLADGLEAGPALDVSGPVDALEVSVADGLVFVGYGDSGTIGAWDFEDGGWSDLEIEHGAPISRLLVSDANGLIVSGGQDGVVRRWSLPTGEAIGQPIPFAEEPVTGMAIADDLLVVGADFSPIRTFALSSGAEHGVPIDMPNGTLALATAVHLFSDGSEKEIVINADDQGVIRRLDPVSGEEIRSQVIVEQQSGGIYALAVDGNRVLAAGQYGSVATWYTQHPLPGGNVSLLSGDEVSHGFDVRAIGVTSSGWMATSSDDPAGRTTLWHRPIGRIRGPEQTVFERVGIPNQSLIKFSSVAAFTVSSMAVHAERDVLVASALSGEIAVLDASTLDTIRMIETGRTVTDVALDEDASVLYAAASNDEGRPAVKRHGIDGQEMSELVVPTQGFLQAIALDRASSVIYGTGVAGDLEQGMGLVAAWDRDSGELLWWSELDSWGISAVVYAGRPWIGTSEGSIVGYDPSTGEPDRPLGEERGNIHSLQVTADGLLMAADHQGIVRFWDPESGDEDTARRFIVEQTAVTDTALVADGLVIVSTAGAGSQIWDLVDDEPVGPRFEPQWIYSVTADERGRVFLGMPEGTIQLWDYANVELACSMVAEYETTGRLEASFERELTSCGSNQ